MAKRLLSHLLITLAIFSLSITFYVWFIDSIILNPNKLIPVLKEAGVPSAIANVLPEKATEQQSEVEAKEARAKVAQIVTPEYVNSKMESIAGSVSTYMKQGSPQPVIDISDFPEKLRASGIQIDAEAEKSFSEPINLNKDGQLDNLPQTYKLFKMLKVLGIVIFAALLVLEWFVAAKGTRSKLIGRIFLHTSIWFFVLYGVVVLVPKLFISKIKESVGDQSVNGLIDAVASAMQKLFGDYFLSFAIICGMVAAALYILRHTKKHITAIQDVKDPKKAAVKNKPAKK